METITLFRDDIRKEGIRGTLFARREIFHILERPWRNNWPNKSCIPATDGVNGTPRTGDATRDSTIGTNFGITY